MNAMTRGVVGAVLVAGAGQASAIGYDLCAGVTTKTMPDGAEIAMWGYGLDTGGPCAPTVPGPRLTLPPGDTTLTVNLRNELSVAVSLVIAGQQAALTPVFFTDGQGRQRVRSFTHESASGATGVYSWSNLKPGTYLYSSGTHPAVQVQMGLYGALTQDTAANEAYPGVPYDGEALLLYSEIDPALHAAVADGSYGTPSHPSTIDYAPRYFLVNGAPHTTATAPLAVAAAGQRTLIRFLNAGLEEHAPLLQGRHLTLVAEDGNPYPQGRQQYSVLLAAGKTRDAIFTPETAGSYPLYDRRLRVGLRSELTAAAAAAGPTAVDDAATVTEDAAASVIAVLANDTAGGAPLDATTLEIALPAAHGQALANADGTASYAPNADFNGLDSFTYRVRDSANNLSNAATVSVTVTAVNDAPSAVADAYAVSQGSSNHAFDVLANDSDVDGDALTITAVGPASNGGTVGINGTALSYSPSAGYTGVETFSYTIGDGNGGSASATVTVTVNPVVNQPPVANDDYATVKRNTNTSANTVTINLVANDTDADGTINAASLVITTSPLKGTAVNNGNGTVTYRPGAGKRGSDAFGYRVGDDDGATSNEATVRVDLVK